MLKLNSQDNPFKPESYNYLNTSYVKVKPTITAAITFIQNNLNTSYVKVKQIHFRTPLHKDKHLNTSYVKVKLFQIKLNKIHFGKFKYILC